MLAKPPRWFNSRQFGCLAQCQNTTDSPPIELCTLFALAHVAALGSATRHLLHLKDTKINKRNLI